MPLETDRPIDRVRRHTGRDTCAKIDEQTRGHIRAHAADSPADLGRRISELGREWDVERTLELNASTLALTGAILGTTVSRKWFWLTGGVLSFLFQHATSGWCPPLPILRRLGIRTRSEIDREKFALKALRGDFDQGTQLRPGPDAAFRATATAEPDGNGGSHREPDRIRRYTSRTQLRRLDAAAERRVRLYAHQPTETFDERIAELRREWSIERYLQINVAAVGLGTLALAVTKDRRWGFATCAGLAFFLFHAVEGFDPPLPLLRKLGVRSRDEIDREIYALKILRGDFDRVFQEDRAPARTAAALEAVNA